MDKILHLTNRLKEAKESNNVTSSNNIKASESNEDSLDTYISLYLHLPTLSKSDKKKMKIELQNLHKEETKLIKLINLVKPANLPLVSKVCIESKDNEKQKITHSTKKISQLEKRRKLFEKVSRFYLYIILLFTIFPQIYYPFPMFFITFMYDT